ncbi:MAG: hypothetical protein GXX92_12570 [Clostridiales bacterium]|nr:hypothetical protein [Clostridiales bacterium]
MGSKATKGSVPVGAKAAKVSVPLAGSVPLADVAEFYECRNNELDR